MRYLLISFLTMFSIFSFSQERINWGLEARVKYGFLLGHRVVMGHIAQNHTYAAELSFVYRPNGQKEWHENYKYPDLSVNLYFGNVGNAKILGNYFGAYTSIAFPFVAKEKFRLSGKLGCGLGYSSKAYDEVFNKKNSAISSHINALINIGIDTRTYFKNNWILFGIDLTHFSNGATKVPNLGLNIPQISLGYGRFINYNKEHSTIKKPSYLPQHRFLFGVTAIGSYKQVYPTNGRTYPVFALNFHTRMFMRPRIGWELAFDIMSNQAILGYRTEVKKTQSKLLQLGIFAGYLLPFNNFHIIIGMGAYVRDFYKPEGPFYHKVGLRYYLKSGVHFQVVLKSHWAKADYIEWGVGYTFLNRKKDTK